MPLVTLTCPSAVLMRYADVVFSLIFQATLLHSPPNALKLLGCACIMSVIVSAYLQAQRKARAKAAAEKATAAADASVASHASASAGTSAPIAKLAAGTADAAAAAGDGGYSAGWDTSRVSEGSAGRSSSPSASSQSAGIAFAQGGGDTTLRAGQPPQQQLESEDVLQSKLLMRMQAQSPASWRPEIAAV